MSDPHPPTAADTPAPSAPDVPPARASKPPRPPRPPRRGVAAAIALVLALLALLAVAVVGWQVWQVQRSDRAGSQSMATLRQQVSTLRSRLDKSNQQVAALDRQLQAAASTRQGLSQQLQGVSERTRNLESAVASLSDRQLTAHDAWLLDQAAALLRMGQQRYTLFHDAAGALKAYALADQTLAELDGPGFAGVRDTLDREREALAATHPASRQADLATLARLRARLPTLPLKPLDAPTATAAQGFWPRLWHALSTLVVVDRVTDAPLDTRDTHIARQLAALDAAQAEAARLAWNDAAWRAALKRVDAALATDFDTDASSVQQARAAIAALLARPKVAPPQLGAALQELNDVRDVQDTPRSGPLPAASTPAPAASVPAPAASTPAPARSSAGTRT